MRVPDLLELELQTVVSCNEGSGIPPESSEEQPVLSAERSLTP